jgi:hypothetical protein
MRQLLLPVLAGLAVAACSGKPAPRTANAPPPPPRSVAVSDDTAAVARDAAKLGNWPVKIGKPYQVAGITYYPADEREYREEGVASWYGPGFHAGSTANGERYDQDDLTAAHRTLPMPSWVEVENLDNGRKLTVRINDRGPFARGRIIDLSRKAAQLLGVLLQLWGTWWQALAPDTLQGALQLAVGLRHPRHVSGQRCLLHPQRAGSSRLRSLAPDVCSSCAWQRTGLGQRPEACAAAGRCCRRSAGWW